MNSQIPQPVGDEEIVYTGKLIELVHQKMNVGHKEFTVEFARRAPGTRLIIVSNENKILLTKEYRSELRDWDIRLPGGKVFDSLVEYKDFLSSKKNIQEEAEKAAKKEAREEVGLDVQSITFFAVSSCGVTMIWDLYYFVVDQFDKNPQGQELELGENISLQWVSFDEAKKMCLDATMGEDRSAAVLLRYLSKIS